MPAASHKKPARDKLRRNGDHGVEIFADPFLRVGIILKLRNETGSSQMSRSRQFCKPVTNRPSGVRRGANITRTAMLIAMPVSFSQRQQVICSF